MSYILEALRRAERERQAGQTGESLAGGRPLPAPRVRPTTIALAALTLFLAGVGAAVLLLRPPGTAAVPLPEAAPQPAPQPAPRPLPAPEPVSRATPVPTPQATIDERSLPADDAGSLDDITPVFQGTPPQGLTVSGVPIADASVRGATATTAQSLVRPGPAPLQEPAPEPIRAPMQPGSITPAVASAPPEDATKRPPTLRELPDTLRARFPELVLQVHVYDAEPARRWIMVANRRHGEGTALDGGLRVTEIRADGVIFELDGQRVFWPLTR